jgi:hypothetical protein
MPMIQVTNEISVDPDLLPYDPHLYHNGSPLIGLFISGMMLAVWAGYTVLWVWMLIHCFRYEPDRLLWFLIIFFVPLGSLVYFFARWLPNRQMQAPQALKRWTRGGEISRLETAAVQIGNPHQYIQLGDALREVGSWQRAETAYAQALQKDPTNLQALWGLALVAIHRRDYATSRDYLAKVLEIDPQYKFGDVSLEYGKALHELGEREAAREHLQTHIRRWRHPEALYRLALILADEGRFDEARAQLQAMLLDINGSPKSVARRFAVWKSRARKVLRKLPQSRSVT